MCDSDATVVCQKTGNATLVCECVYVTGLEDLPLCESTEEKISTSISNGKVISTQRVTLNRCNDDIQYIQGILKKSVRFLSL